MRSPPVVEPHETGGVAKECTHITHDVLQPYGAIVLFDHAETIIPRPNIPVVDPALKHRQAAKLPPILVIEEVVVPAAELVNSLLVVPAAQIGGAKYKIIDLSLERLVVILRDPSRDEPVAERSR